MAYTLTFTALEMEMLSISVRNHADALDQYRRWIDDRPMLPAQSKAVDMVNAESRRYRELQLKIYEAVKPKAAA